MPTQHFPFGGSNIGRRILCAASMGVEAKAPKEPPSVYAEEGTVAHEVLEAAILRGDTNVDHLLGVGEGVTRDMVYGVRIALEYVKQREAETGEKAQAEQAVMWPGSDIAGGTADICFPTHREIADFKFGFDQVEADAPQLLFYAVCRYGVSTPVTCTIIQPRGFHPDGPVRSVTVSAERLAAFKAEVDEAIARGTADAAPYAPSIEACRRCKGVAVCPALADHAKSMPTLRNVVSGAAQSFPSPSEMTADELGFVLGRMDMAEKWFDAVRTYAYTKAMEGTAIPGRKLVAGNTKRSWPNDKSVSQVAAELAEMGGLTATDFVRDGLISLTDAEKKLTDAFAEVGVAAKDAKRIVKDRLAFLVDREKSDKLTLVSTDDKRQAVNRAARDFAGITFNQNVKE